MEIRPLSRDVISRIRSSCNINCVTQCVTELVLNSLDAKSSAIAIRINSINFRIQVVDNGVGISQENMEQVAHQYSTSKCANLSDLEKKGKTHGYRGESLWSISIISKIVNITSKASNCDKTFSKNILKGKHGKVTLTKNRHSNGTTVTIDGFFCNLPVRQKRMKRDFEVDEIINCLKCISIIYSQLSLSLRDDLSGKLLFKCQKHNSVIQSFVDLYPEIKEVDLTVMKVRKEKIAIEALLLKEIMADKIIQIIFINRRPVYYPKLHNFLCHALLKDNKKKISTTKNLYPMFVINIKCSLSCFDLTYKDYKPTVEFKNSDSLDRCIEKLVSNFLGKPGKVAQIVNNNKKPKSTCGVSDLVGAVKGYAFKNWLKNNQDKKTSIGIETPTNLEDEIEEIGLQPAEMKTKNTSKTFVKQLDKKHRPLPIEILDKKNNKKNIALQNSNKNSFDSQLNKIHNELDVAGNVKTSNPIEKKDPDIISETIVREDTNEAIIRNYKKLENNCMELISNRDLDKTIFSHFTNNEDKGKNLIMYLFLKSTELFPENNSKSNFLHASDESYHLLVNDSKETIMESNILFQNVTNTGTHRMNKTISVSVKVKQRRKEKLKNNDILSNFTFSTLEPKRKKYLNENPNCLSLKRKNHFTSPFFKRQKPNDDPNYAYRETADKIIQTTFTPRNRVQVEFSDIFRMPIPVPKHKSTKIIYQKPLDPLDRTKREMFTKSKRNIFQQQDLMQWNFDGDFFQKPLANYEFEGFGRIFVQDEEDILESDKKNKALYTGSNSCLFHFGNRNVFKGKYDKKIQFFNEPPQKKDRLQLSICNIEKEQNTNILMGRDRRFSNQNVPFFKKNDFPNHKSFDFENLSLSTIPKICTSTIQNKCSTNLKYFKTGNVEKPFSFRKFASEGSNGNKFFRDEVSNYAYLNANRNYSFSLIDSDSKNRDNERCNTLHKFKKFHTEPIDDSRTLYVERVKKNLDRLFQRTNPKLQHCSMKNKSKNDIDTENFTKDSLESANNLENENIPQIKGLWRKFIEKKKSFGSVDENPVKIPLFEGFGKSSIKNISFHAKNNAKESTQPSAPNRNLNKEYVSPDMFSDTKISEHYIQHDLTFLPNSVPSSEFEMNSSIPDLDMFSKKENVQKVSNLPTLTAVGTGSSNLVITLNDGVGRTLIENDSEVDAKMNVGSADVLSIDDVKNEWISKFDHRGNEFFFNSKTGMTSFVRPQQDEGFTFKLRPHFMPKGLSPVLVQEEKLDKSLSPSSKGKLHGEILRSYENELDIVKWIKCLKNLDPKKFFEDIYKEKAMEFENEIPSVNEVNLRQAAKLSHDCNKFNNTLFNDLQIIGQVDRKFIAVMDKKHLKLILFDQHAVHERIRLESLQKDYEGVSTPCENVTLFMFQNDVKILKSHEKYLNDIGIHFRTLKNGITVHKVPLCLKNKVKKEPKESTWTLPKLVELLIQEMVKHIKDTRGVLTSVPKTIHQIISMEACRGSIKFGDTVSKAEMEKHMKNLSNCTLPFQCAHGRPTLVPILTLNQELDMETSRPNIWRLCNY